MAVAPDTSTHVVNLSNDVQNAIDAVQKASEEAQSIVKTIKASNRGLFSLVSFLLLHAPFSLIFLLFCVTILFFSFTRVALSRTSSMDRDHLRIGCA